MLIIGDVDGNSKSDQGDAHTNFANVLMNKGEIQTNGYHGQQNGNNWPITKRSAD